MRLSLTFFAVGSLWLHAFSLQSYYIGVYSGITMVLMLILRPMQRLYKFSGRLVEFTQLSANNYSLAQLYTTVVTKCFARNGFSYMQWTLILSAISWAVQAKIHPLISSSSFSSPIFILFLFTNASTFSPSLILGFVSLPHHTHTAWHWQSVTGSVHGGKFLNIYETKQWILEPSILHAPKRLQIVSLCIC